MRFLVTGGTGFIGSYLTRLLVAEGDEVVVLDRFPRLARIADLLDCVTVVEGDIRDLDTIAAIMDERGIERVVHLAGVPGAVHPERTVEYTALMCSGTANVFEAARRLGIRRVVNASSVAVYGFGAVHAEAATEDSPAFPTDLYGACKLWSEGLARVLNERGGMEILSLRICSAFGLGRLDRASLDAGLTGERITAMAYPELLARGEPVTMPPDDAVFDFLYAPDAAAAFRVAAVAARPANDVFNLRAEQRPFGDLTRSLRTLLPGAEIAVSSEPPGELRLTLMDNSRLIAELGFRPRWTLESGLADYVRCVQAEMSA